MMTAKIYPFEPLSLEIKPLETVGKWGKTIVFAPHPDDESLGCGGAIALLRKYDLPVEVITMTDGTLSHPNSRKFPAGKLRATRESEMIAALKILDVEAKNVSFLRYPDRSLPAEGEMNFASAVESVKNQLAEKSPQTVLVPWRRDPHPDHRATWQIVRAALGLIHFTVRVIEYPIWLWEIAKENDLPEEDEISAWRLNIENVIDVKQAAIRAHVSQTTNLIDDDPQGFRLSPEMLAHFAVPFETFFENVKNER